MSIVAIIESGGANFTSIRSALTRLGASSVVTSDPQEIQAATHVILPGVGAAGYAMKLLGERKLVRVIQGLKQPLLGICLGQQLLCTHSEEDDTPCLGLIPVNVKYLSDVRIVPHMGWNNLENIDAGCALLKGISAQDDFYFVHSFAAEIKSPATLATCDYGQPFSAVVQKDNFYGVQFHPEKSGKAGLRVLENFVRLS